MRPTLHPGDGLLGLRWKRARPGQVRVFPDPTMPGRWLVKRVGGVRGTGARATFEACSDNPHAPGVVDSRRFGWVPAQGSYRVVWSVRGATRGPETEESHMSVVLLALVSSCVLAVCYRILSRSTHSRVGRPQRAPIGDVDGHGIPWSG